MVLYAPTTAITIVQSFADLQVISNMVDFGMEPQAALDAPRWRVMGVDSALGPESVRTSRSASNWDLVCLNGC